MLRHVVQLYDADKLIAIDDVDVTAEETDPAGSVPINTLPMWLDRPTRARIKMAGDIGSKRERKYFGLTDTTGTETNY